MFESYYNLSFYVCPSVCLSVPHLLRCLLTDIGASALLLIAKNAPFCSVCAGESQAGNPIGSALVLIVVIILQLCLVMVKMD